MKNTLEDYLLTVKQQVERAKSGTYASFLLNPSPAQLRNFCLLLLDNKLNKSDEAIFRIFFQAPEDVVLRKSIENFDVEKFKAVGNFLKGISQTTNIASLNLIAILTDCTPRPFNRFIKEEKSTVTEPLGLPSVPIKNLIVNTITSPTTVLIAIKQKTVLFSQIVKIVLLSIMLLSTAYGVKEAVYPNKQCMQWQTDHYEAVECDVSKKNRGFNTVIPFDAITLKIKRIEVNKKTPFFHNDTPLVWYLKRNGKPEFFSNGPGYYPETNKPLKPITQYMIDKYVKND